MKRTLNILCLLGLLVGSCFEPPEFSIIPSISVLSVRGKEVPGPSTKDSLIVTIQFKDGDGDIGVDADENTPPYHERWFFLKTPIQTCDPGVKAPCSIISFVDTSANKLKNYVSYKSKRTSADYDTLPEFISPYNCFRYYTLLGLKNGNLVTKDTLYSVLNPRYNNFFMELLVKDGSTFKKFEFDTPYPNCELYGFDGRLPILAKDGNVSLQLPLEGTITYKVASPSFYSTLRNKTLKLRIRIMDRAGHSSNTNESIEFTLK